MSHKIALFFLMIVAHGCSTMQSRPSAPEKPLRSIVQIGDAFFDFILAKDPLYATYIGDHRFDDALPDLKDDTREREYQTLASFKKELEFIGEQNISADERLQYEFLLQEIETLLDMRSCQFPLWFVDQLEGPHIALAELAKDHRIQKPLDLQNLIKRFNHAPQFFADHIDNLRKGRERGLTAAKITIQHVIEQLENELNHLPQTSPFMISSDQLPKSINKNLRRELTNDLLDVVTTRVYPSLRAYRDYLKYELMPDARDHIGLHALSLGNSCYRTLIRRHTGLTKSPKEIHQQGLQEVERIKSEMVAVLKKATGQTNIKSHMNALKKDPLQYFKTSDEMIAYNKNLVARAHVAVKKAFGHVPKTELMVIPLEEFRQKHAPVAYYYEAPVDGSRPAFYYLNTYRPDIRPIYNMAALAFHEAIPGHHMQIAIANENKTLPAFQRHLGQTAFIEGWALYAEFLARELGLYANSEELFGSLTYELWRALRLVVDTGIHNLGWSREHAMSYLATNTALSDEEVANEVDRYTVWPAQALSYKIGQLEISALRRMCEEALGKQFSLAAFHDQILKNGAMPMATLRKATVSWLKEQKTNATAVNHQ